MNTQSQSVTLTESSRPSLLDIPREKKRLFLQQKLIPEARNNFYYFATIIRNGYDRAKHLKALTEKLEAVERGDIRKLMICMPPRHSKTETAVIRFIPWYLGRNQDHRVMYVTYGASLAHSKSRKARSIFKSERYQAIFNIDLAQDSQAVGMWNVEDRDGGLLSAGIDGALTGEGFNLLLLDDLIKGRKEAESKTVRDSTWDALMNEVETRAEPDAKTIFITTRWHEDDPAGRYLQAEPGEWETFILPAIAEDDDIIGRSEGEALWPERFDIENFAKRKTILGSYGWNALYQQRPSPSEGNIINRSWWKYYDLAPECDQYIQSWDCAFKGTDTSDYVVGQLWGRKDANRYLIDEVRARMDFPATIEAIRNFTLKHPQAKKKLIEDKANGTAIISVLKNEIQGIVPVAADSTTGGKLARLRAVSPQIEAGNVYLPRTQWTADFVEELATFPNGANDDRCDALSQALAELDKPLRKARMAFS